jgi:hypothetical protein
MLCDGLFEAYTKLAGTRATSIVLGFIVMNLEKRLRLLLCKILNWLIFEFELAKLQIRLR